MKWILPAVLTLLLAACQSDDKGSNPPPPDFAAGKNRFTTVVDGDTREYFVHVPAAYHAGTAVPVVFMFHGSGQSGEQFYNISGWKEVGEQQNILTVFPTSWSYCLTEDGATLNETKWAEYPGGIDYCAGQRQRDDLKFVRTMLTELEARFSIDSDRVYAVGFSNGGKFAARCAVDLSDRFAATVSSGGGGALPSDTTLTPVDMLPVMLEFGTRDAKLLTRLGVPGPLPMSFTKLFATYPGLSTSLPKPFVDAFAQDPVNFTVTGDSASYIVANFHGLSNDPKNIFKLVEVRGLEHEYPNGVNHELNGAQLHWAWMREFSR